MYYKNCNLWISTSYTDLKNDFLVNMDQVINNNSGVIIEYYIIESDIYYLSYIEMVKDSDNNTIEFLDHGIPYDKTVNYINPENIKKIINNKITDKTFCNIQIIP